MASSFKHVGLKARYAQGACHFSVSKLLSPSSHHRQRSSIPTTAVHTMTESNPDHSSQRLFSGIQPTSDVPHLGNYIGAIKNWVSLQSKHSSVILSLVDLHTITLPHKPQQLRNNILDMTACLLACGLDPTKVILFQQSQIPQHTELAWILSCNCSLPRLKHLPQWKLKSKNEETVSVGLFSYPLLQAADILLYKSQLVPVGEDQVKHIELARDLVKQFNRKYGNIFVKPNILTGELPKVLSLQNPEDKMSKSDNNKLSRIDLTDSADEIFLKIKKARTDSTSAVTYDPANRPGVSNLISIHSNLTDLTPEQLCKEYTHLDTGQYKKVVAEAIIETVTPISSCIKELKANKDYLIQVLETGKEKATNISENTMKTVKEVLGFTLH
ncbi:tryptophan--tRNA ligase, mitochondrial [Octopus sinensis]|uniref:Tryptophan--tRNA ligase, mitochondrial n=1 Tax=Octopus sinensis TaxID=2607531 RepID=A0A6P7U4R5_9MOLL|nr:tryptophan--tRNA ligase, mitochondrial [Octopus sinensis]